MRKIYEFIYNDKVVAKGYFKPYKVSNGVDVPEVQMMAIGIVYGLRMSLKHPKVKVYEVGEEKRTLVLVQE